MTRLFLTAGYCFALQVSATLGLEQHAEVTSSWPSLDGLRVSSLDVVGETFKVENTSPATISLVGWTVRSATGAVNANRSDLIDQETLATATSSTWHHPCTTCF